VVLFAPGTGMLYSNFGFDCSPKLSGTSPEEPLSRTSEGAGLDPAGLKDARFNVPESERAHVMLDHNFDGSPFPISEKSP
jgi:D-alanyl-D-alanine-carboxypeptidase/D-alanyl-D-alanine-endopeptidase